jgi:hypothetical protein
MPAQQTSSSTSKFCANGLPPPRALLVNIVVIIPSFSPGRKSPT